MNEAEAGIIRRAWHFFQKPFHEQSRAFYAHWKKVLPAVPFPVRLPFGAWFLARNDGLGATLTYDGFELPERLFVARFLRKAMTVLDIGAHQGFYTLLASKTVGPDGKVFSFEPSPREQKALYLNLILNRCKNVSFHEIALGDQETQADLYVVNGQQSGFNSLRRPGIPGPTTQVMVHVKRLDDWLHETNVDLVDFIKLDVEGGELAVLQGAPNLLRRCPRPVILAELEDARSAAWGHRAKDTASLLHGLGFHWFKPLEDGILEKMPENPDHYEGNFVAVPEERLGELVEMTKNGSRS